MCYGNFSHYYLVSFFYDIFGGNTSVAAHTTFHWKQDSVALVDSIALVDLTSSHAFSTGCRTDLRNLDELLRKHDHRWHTFDTTLNDIVFSTKSTMFLNTNEAFKEKSTVINIK